MMMMMTINGIEKLGLGEFTEEADDNLLEEPLGIKERC